MTLKLTVASFLACVKKSGLIEPERLDQLVEEFRQQGTDCNQSSEIAAALVERKVLTEWQSEKLLQGRHLGFILGRYKLLSLLGAGEMSSVYLAEHVMMERKCAIKVLPANKVQDTSYLERFRREALAVASMNHVNIVRAYDVDKKTENGADIHFLVMEYVAGRNLEQLVKEQGPLDFVSAVDYIRQAADGLAHAHQLQMVHRDVKPGNLLIDSTGCVKVLDLGLARFFKTTQEESLTIKHDEKVLGTADYLAPEQAIDSHRVDARADIYSLGCTLYFALTGHSPFTDGTLVQRLLAHQTKSPPTVRYERPDIDDELLAILDKMMAKKCADRYQSAIELSEALARWLIQHAPAAWKRQHLSLVALLNDKEGMSAESPGEDQLVMSGQKASVMSEESAGNDRTVSAPPVSLATESQTERRPQAQSKARERRPGSSVRLASSSLETTISRQLPPVRRVASRLTVPTSAKSKTAPAGTKPSEPAGLPLVNRNRTRVPLRKLNEPVPSSPSQALMLSFSQISPRVLLIAGTLLTTMICACCLWYFVHARENLTSSNSNAATTVSLLQ